MTPSPRWGLEGADLFVQNAGGARSYFGSDQEAARAAFIAELSDVDSDVISDVPNSPAANSCSASTTGCAP